MPDTLDTEKARKLLEMLSGMKAAEDKSTNIAYAPREDSQREKLRQGLDSLPEDRQEMIWRQSNRGDPDQMADRMIRDTTTEDLFRRMSATGIGPDIAHPVATHPEAVRRELRARDEEESARRQADVARSRQTMEDLLRRGKQTLGYRQ